MREVDRITVEDFGLGLLQMMENAGRNLALSAQDMLSGNLGPVMVLAGAGGNGGGGLCAARHLHNRGVKVDILLDREPDRLGQAASLQMKILQGAGLHPTEFRQAERCLKEAKLVIDALIGYRLRGAPKATGKQIIDLCNEYADQVLALDIPSGMHATDGHAPGVMVRADRTLTLALPKIGLAQFPGEIILADIGIPPEVYLPLGLELSGLFNAGYLIPLFRRENING
jgi:NAD(P)H-hydrate epimerase